MIQSSIPIKILTSQKQVSIEIRCTITPELEILIPPSLKDKNQKHTVNVTYETYHELNGVPIKVENPLLSAIRNVIQENYYITHVALMPDNLIAITEGLIFKHTHIYQMKDNEIQRVT